jgi:SAM-dependent methyltransferase
MYINSDQNFNIDKAGTDYWDSNWENSSIPMLFSDKNNSLDNFVNFQFHNFFKGLFGEQRGFSILELGCANSIWPIYFSQFFEAHADGIDYSAVGCKKSRQLLDYFKLPGQVHCADLFSPPENLINKYDYVISFGVVEHFQNTSECLEACSAFLRPGGTLITVIPNMAGIIGTIQKWAAPEVYDVHVPLTNESLANAHQSTALTLVNSAYFMSINLSVVNSGKFSDSPYNNLFRRILSAPSKVIWILEKFGLTIPTTATFSPYIIATGQKKLN